MESETNQPSSATIWKPIHAYTLAAVCLVIGIAVGYLVRGSAAPKPPVASAVVLPQTADPHAAMTDKKMPSLDEMKQMADKQAEPLLAKLKDDPKNADLLNKVGSLYRVTHQFKTAAEYYQKALEIDPKNVGARTDLASCLFYEGDIDGAIAQLHDALKYDPNHAGALLNLGLIEWKGKGDSKAAIGAWEKLLKLHPDFAQKDAVLHMIDVAKLGKPDPAIAEKQ